MAKTTNILDLNNRLEKVEKGNVAQNSYTSLKNKPKINNVTLTGNKSLADIGAAAASDLTTLAGNVGDKAQLTTTDKSSTVAAINEVNRKTSATHETVVPNSDFYVEDWHIDRIGDLRLLTITSIKDLSSGYNTSAQLSSSDKPCRTFLVRLGDVTIRVRDDRYIDVIVDTAISGTTNLNVVIPFTI